MHLSCTENFTTATRRNPGDETCPFPLLQFLLVEKWEVLGGGRYDFYQSGLEFSVCYANVFIEKAGAEGGSPIKTNEAH